MSARVSLWAEFPGKGYVPVCSEHGNLRPEWGLPTLGDCQAVVDDHNEAEHTTPQEKAIREAYGLLEGAVAYGKRQAINAAMEVLRPHLLGNPFGKHEADHA